MIFSFPCLLAPYFVHIGNKSENYWTSYFISVVSVFIFSMLQGVHDKLDNPYDGMGEDDVDTNVFEEWVIQTLELSHGGEGGEGDLLLNGDVAAVSETDKDEEDMLTC